MFWAVFFRLIQETFISVSYTHLDVYKRQVYRNQISEQPDILEKLKGKRILLAEDNDLNAEIAIELLAEEKIVVDRAKDGARCV